MSSTVRSSLSYQLLLHINKPFALLLYIILIILMAYKGTVLPYSSHVFTVELLLVLVFGPLEAIRIASGSRGNLTETSSFVALATLLTGASIALCVYLAAFQSYVLLLEEILICMEGLLLILEAVMGLVMVGTMSRPRT